MSQYACYVFDAYGTLFDVHSAASRHKDAIGDQWDRLSQTWRAKHLEYTWIWALTGRHTSFWHLAEESLDFASASVGSITPETRAALLNAYRSLSTYPEVDAVLSGLKAKGAKLAILTNGDPDLITHLVAATGHTATFDALITVHEAGAFKPVPRVYELVTDRFGCAPAEISFQSSNRWDVTGAKVAGFRTVWINRTLAPAEYPETPPDLTVRDLAPLLTD